jgi:tyrosinase
LSPAAIPTPVNAPTPVRHRRNARLLTAGQLADLRQALTRVQALTDDRGYQHWAGIHGLPLPISCTHHNHLFLPWHRAYLYMFEKALQDQVPGVTLPWWDWTVHHEAAIPPAYDAQQANGSPNPLYDSPIQPRGRRDPDEERTWREAGRDGALPSPRQLARVMANTDFFTFQTQLESIHDGVHMWVGGTMGDISVAAYDPLFWANHCMIDRLWYLWQLRHAREGPPRTLLPRALPPFPLTVRDTLEVLQLGYDYAARTVAAAGPAAHDHG